MCTDKLIITYLKKIPVTVLFLLQGRGKANIKIPLEQAMKALKGRTGIALLILFNLDVRWEWVV